MSVIRMFIKIFVLLLLKEVTNSLNTIMGHKGKFLQFVLIYFVKFHPPMSTIHKFKILWKRCTYYSTWIDVIYFKAPSKNLNQPKDIVLLQKDARTVEVKWKACAYDCPVGYKINFDQDGNEILECEVRVLERFWMFLFGGVCFGFEFGFD